MSGKRYYWLKLKTDFFSNKLIKKMRRLPGGDNLLIIYMKLLLVSLENNGVIQIDGIEEEIAEELSIMIDEPVDNIQLLLAYCFKNGLVTQVEHMDDLEMTQAKALLGSETAAAERKRRQREKQKMIEKCDNVTKTSHMGHVEIEIDTDIEIEKELDNRVLLRKSNTSIEIEKSKCSSGGSTPFLSIAYEYQRLGFGQLSGTVAELIQADVAEYGEEWCKAAMNEATLNNVHSWRYVEAILKRWKNTYSLDLKPWEIERQAYRENDRISAVKNALQKDGESDEEDTSSVDYATQPF